MAEAEVGLRLSLKDRVAVARGLRETADELDGIVDAGTRVEKSSKRSGGMLGRLAKGGLGALKAGAIGAAGAVAGLGATALWKGFNRLQGIDQARAKLTGLGHSAKGVDQIMDNALNSVKGTAFGLDAAATTAAGAVAAGVKPGKDLERTLSLVGDAATIAGTDMGSMGSIFNKVAAADMIQGDVLAQLGDAGIPILQLLSKELGVTAAEVRDMASKGSIDFATFQNAMEGGLGGAAQASGKTFSGALANAQAALGRLGANLLGGVFQQMPGLFGKATEALDQLGPVATRAGEWLGEAFTRVVPLVSKVVDYFSGSGGGGLLDGLKRTASVVVATVGPAVMNLVTLFRDQVIPTVLNAAGYISDHVVPVLQTMADIFRDKVLPIVGDVAGFITGSLYPAIFKIYQNVGQKLKPVFEQYVETLRERVLPTVSDLLERFREWWPTIKRVISIVVSLVGKVLGFAAAILGKVLPIVIRLAGFFISKLVPIIATVIGWVVKIIGKVLDFAGSVRDAISTAKNFATVLRDKVVGGVTDVVTAVTELPGKIRAVGQRMFDAGKSIIGKFVDGLKETGGVVSDIAGNVWDALKGLINSAIDKINRALEFPINLPGKTITINPPDIEKLAKGGPVEAGRPYVVGDGGRPELFVPRTDGHVLPRVPDGFDEDGSLPSLGGGIGGTIIKLVMPDGRQLAEVVLDELDDLAALA